MSVACAVKKSSGMEPARPSSICTCMSANLSLGLGAGWTRAYASRTFCTSACACLFGFVCSGAGASKPPT